MGSNKLEENTNKSVGNVETNSLSDCLQKQEEIDPFYQVEVTNDCLSDDQDESDMPLQDELMEKPREPAADIPNSSLQPVEQWIRVSPPTRQSEVDYLNSEKLGFPMKIIDNGDLQQPFLSNKWLFLLVLDKAFPKRTSYGTVPAHVYLVSPSIDELEEKGLRHSLSQIQYDESGLAYIEFGTICEKEYERYYEGHSSNRFCATLLGFTREWIKSVQKEQKGLAEKESRRTRFPFSLFQQKNDQDNSYSGFNTKHRPKYVNGQLSKGNETNPRCRKVVLSDRAYIQIFNESQARIQTETGGLLLGHFDKGVWYVVEASDPGINAKFFGAYHEGDDVYENHVCGVISRTYKYPLVFLGMWHRHPGSLDSFSGTDDGTNYKYAHSAGNGCISAIINYDPNFRITFYYVEQGEQANVLYTRVDVEIGNDKFANPEMMKIASPIDVLKRS